MDQADKRMHTRTQYFLIKDEKQAIPIYAFRDPSDLLAIPALVVDIGEGGVQILTTRGADLSQQAFNLELVDAGEPSDTELRREQIQMVWSREDGTNIRTGFAFTQGLDVGARWVQILESAPHRLLRCILHPV